MRPDRYEYLDRHIDERADENDRAIDHWNWWPLDFDGFDPDDREPMGGDPHWAGDLEWD